MVDSPSSGAIIQAAADPHILDRAIALAVREGIPGADAALRSAQLELAVSPVDDTGNATVASVYEYGRSRIPLPPGRDPSVLQDAQILHAIRHLTATGILPQKRAESPT